MPAPHSMTARGEDELLVSFGPGAIHRRLLPATVNQEVRLSGFTERGRNFQRDRQDGTSGRCAACNPSGEAGLREAVQK